MSFFYHPTNRSTTSYNLLPITSDLLWGPAMPYLIFDISSRGVLTFSKTIVNETPKWTYSSQNHIRVIESLVNSNKKIITVIWFNLKTYNFSLSCFAQFSYNLICILGLCDWSGWCVVGAPTNYCIFPVVEKLLFL